MKCAFPILLGLAIGACTAPPPPINGDITGSWHGLRWEGQARIHWLSRIAEDGEIDIRFMTCFNGDVIGASHQFGRGALEDGVFRIELARIEFVNPESGETVESEGFDHDYAMTELTAQRMRYYSMENGERYEAARVSAQFELECEPATLNVRTEPGARRARDAWITRMAEPDDDDQAEEDSDL